MMFALIFEELIWIQMLPEIFRLINLKKVEPKKGKLSLSGQSQSIDLMIPWHCKNKLEKRSNNNRAKGTS